MEVVLPQRVDSHPEELEDNLKYVLGKFRIPKVAL